MLNSAAFKLLSDPKRVPGESLRLLVRLMALYDLRNWRVINADTMAEEIGSIPHPTTLPSLVKCGLLEKQSLGVRKVSVLDGVFLYRVRPMYLLTTTEVEAQFREIAERTERETLLTSPTI